MFLFSGFGMGGGSIGQLIVNRAMRDVGRTEEGGNNRGAVVSELMRATGMGQGNPWCAGASTTWINEACAPVLGRNLVQPTASVAQSMSDYRNAGQFTAFNGSLDNVRVGDSVFFRRGGGGGHMALVTGVGNGTLSLVEGNVGMGGTNTDTGRDGVRTGDYSIADLQARDIIGFGHNEQRAAAMAGHVPQINMASIGSFSVPNNLPTLGYDPARTVG